MMLPDIRVYYENEDEGDDMTDFTATFTNIPKEDVIGNEINKLRTQIRDSVSFLVFMAFVLSVMNLVWLACIMQVIFT